MTLYARMSYTQNITCAHCRTDHVMKMYVNHNNSAKIQIHYVSISTFHTKFYFCIREQF